MAGRVALDGELDDGPVAAALAALLPVEESLRTFGDAYYLETPLDVDIQEHETDAVVVGDLAFWPAALAVIAFFGPTPESRPGSDAPAPPSEVALVGKLRDAHRLAEARDAARLRIERA